MTSSGVEKIGFRVLTVGCSVIQGILGGVFMALWWFVSREAEYESFRDGEGGRMGSLSEALLTAFFVEGILSFAVAYNLAARRVTGLVVFSSVQLALGLTFVAAGREAMILSVVTTIVAGGSLGIGLCKGRERAQGARHE